MPESAQLPSAILDFVENRLHKILRRAHSQLNFTRKAAVCLHTFIPICADAKRPNG